jgi:uncharacterized membrane protein YphA (DoxX/SURF4 family)
MRRWLAFLRVGVGALYLYAFTSNVTGDFRALFPTRLQAFAGDNSLGPVRWLLENIAVTHAGFFGWMVLATELLAGVLLVLGLATRVIALLAAVMQVVYLLAVLGTGMVSTITNLLFICALLVIFGTSGGWKWSLDEMIVNRR